MMKKKKLLIVPDSFKGSLSAKEVAAFIAKGFSVDEFEIISVPVSDVVISGVIAKVIVQRI